MARFAAGASRRMDLNGTERAFRAVAALAAELGLAARHDGESRVSASRYMAIGSGVDEYDDLLEPVRVRISDHDDFHGGNDINVHVPVGIVADLRPLARWLGRRYGREALAALYVERIERRIAATERAVETRRAKTAEAEEDLAVEVVLWLRAGGSLQKSGLPRSVTRRHVARVPLLADKPLGTAKRILGRALYVVTEPQRQAAEEARREAERAWGQQWGALYSAHMAARPAGAPRFAWSMEFYTAHPEARR